MEETTSKAADTALRANRQPVPLTPLGLLEMRNAFNNLAVKWKRITAAERDALWQDVEADLASGFLVPTTVPAADLHAKARDVACWQLGRDETSAADLLETLKEAADEFPR